jgi:RimJ/RimL family protein N-acetyltransferase
VGPACYAEAVAYERGWLIRMHPSFRHLARAAESLFGVLFPPEKQRVEARWARRDVDDPLVTPRLLLYPITSDHLQAELAGGHGLGEISGFTVPAEWPPEQWEESAMQYLLDRMEPHGRPGWARYVALPTNGAPLLIGSCGTTSPITEETVEVEVGYSFLPAFHQRRRFRPCRARFGCWRRRDSVWWVRECSRGRSFISLTGRRIGPEDGLRGIGGSTLSRAQG